jgi:uncharacterized protein YigE (DUF2233 family)
MCSRLRFFAVLWMSMFALLASAIGAENGGPCRPVTYERSSYVVCHFDLRHYTRSLFWKQPNGEPFESLKNIPRRDGLVGGQLVFATNGGMYQTDRSPLGLYIENGRELRRANTAVGAGNFYIKPNGIFYVSGDSASILEMRHFCNSAHTQISPRSLVPCL